mmetsp:Transcript_17075/g.51015  ORF Transcript_17075/g.51015 Transcript_17075/m.51015 type:complete len:417 (-) Transcript_17075:447-1697(-)
MHFRAAQLAVRSPMPTLSWPGVGSARHQRGVQQQRNLTADTSGIVLQGRLKPASAEAADAGLLESKADAGSALTGEELSLWRRMANLAQHGNEQGYHMGPCHWQPLVDSTVGVAVHEERSRYNTVVTVKQHGPFRALRFGNCLQSVTITAPVKGQQMASATEVAFGYVRAMAASAAAFGSLAGTWPLCRARADQNGTIVCLGIGGGALPALLAVCYPQTLVQAVDIDPVVISVAKRYMSLSAPDIAGAKNLWVLQQDARACVTNLLKQNIVPEAIFLDCYDAQGRVPPFLTGSTFMGACVQAVAEGGVVVANLFNNTPNGYTRARFASFACHLEHAVGAGNVYSLKAVNQEVNVILVAVKRGDAVLEKPLRHREALEAATQAGSTAGFKFDAALEMRDVFLVHAASVETFHETRLP